MSTQQYLSYPTTLPPPPHASHTKKKNNPEQRRRRNATSTTTFSYYNLPGFLFVVREIPSTDAEDDFRKDNYEHQVGRVI